MSYDGPSPLPVIRGNTGVASQAAYSLVAGGTTTTGAFQAVSSVASGSLLTTAGTSALPAWSAYPQISGLGIGASPGSTAGLTFDGSNFMDNYAISTYTPTVVGGTTAGTTTYSSQIGQYARIGNLVIAWFQIVITGATGTGNANFSLPFSLNSASSNICVGPFNSNSTTWTWQGRNSVNLLANPGNSFAVVSCNASGQNASSLQMFNSAATFTGSVAFRV
jgi:hypothetical protein